MTATDNLDHVKEDDMTMPDIAPPTYADNDGQSHLHSDTGISHDHPWEGRHDHPAGSEESAEVRLERFRRSHEVVPIAVEELESFASDLIRQGYERGRAKVRKEPEVWTAADELSAVKYAQEHGYITDLEAQRKVRKLLRLKGKRVLAVKRRRATRRAR